MAARNVNVPSLNEVVAGIAPDGSQLDIAEILTQHSPILKDAAVKEGNLPTGHRFAVRTGKPTVGFRRMNQGVARSKATSTNIDEGVALLEAAFQVDRENAILSGNPAKYRAQQGGSFVEAMADQASETLIYGNDYFDDAELTGFAPRYNTVANEQVIDAGGTGSDNYSIWLIGWHPQKVSLLYPKGTVGGLQHMDTTANLRPGPDGFPIGDEVEDEDGNTFLAYKDRWFWRLGLGIEDPRYVVRIANIDKSLLTKDVSTGADLEDLMIQAEETIHSLEGVNATFYVPRAISTMLRRQINDAKKSNMGWDKVGGQRVAVFGETPVRRLDALNTDEARVV